MIDIYFNFTNDYWLSFHTLAVHWLTDKEHIWVKWWLVLKSKESQSIIWLIIEQKVPLLLQLQMPHTCRTLALGLYHKYCWCAQAAWQQWLAQRTPWVEVGPGQQPELADLQAWVAWPWSLPEKELVAKHWIDNFKSFNKSGPSLYLKGWSIPALTSGRPAILELLNRERCFNAGLGSWEWSTVAINGTGSPCFLFSSWVDMRFWGDSEKLKRIQSGHLEAGQGWSRHRLLNKYFFLWNQQFLGNNYLFKYFCHWLILELVSFHHHRSMFQVCMSSADQRWLDRWSVWQNQFRNHNSQGVYRRKARSPCQHIGSG